MYRLVFLDTVLGENNNTCRVPKKYFDIICVTGVYVNGEKVKKKKKKIAVSGQQSHQIYWDTYQASRSPSLPPKSLRRASS